MFTLLCIRLSFCLVNCYTKCYYILYVLQKRYQISVIINVKINEYITNDKLNTAWQIYFVPCNKWLIWKLCQNNKIQIRILHKETLSFKILWIKYYIQLRDKVYSIKWSFEHSWLLCICLICDRSMYMVQVTFKHLSNTFFIRTSDKTVIVMVLVIENYT